MATPKTPYLKWRDGRPRWEPGPVLRKSGFKGKNLQDDKGEWLSYGFAVEAAQELNAEVEGWRAGREAKRPQRPPISEQRTCQALFDTYFKSERYRDLRDKTRRDYQSKAKLFLANFGEAPAIAVETSHLHGFWEQTKRTNGHAMANGTMAVVRAVFSHARRIGWMKDNPARDLGLRSTKPRLVTWNPAEITLLVETADNTNLHSVSDAIIIALHSGQRQSDVLALPDRIFKEGRIQLTQFKRGALIDAPMTPMVETRIEQIRARKRAAEITSLESLVIYEGTGKPYKPDLFRKKFTLVRKAAAKKMPSIASKQFMDLRDTAVTRLAMAGCTVPQICAITGHREQTAHQIMRHYLALNSDMANAAIDKLNTWMTKEGITL